MGNEVWGGQFGILCIAFGMEGSRSQKQSTGDVEMAPSLRKVTPI